MKDTVFIDTSGFYALLAKVDDKHQKAKEILYQAAQDKQRFVTTDYVLDETATLLRSRGMDHVTAPLFDIIFTSKACSVIWMDQERFLKAKTFFLRTSDHSWSFTDCASFIVMKEMKLSLSLTTDHHFKEAGFTPIL